MNLKENFEDGENFPTVEEILRSVEKDEEYINHISIRFVNVLDSLSYFVAFNFSQLSDKLEFASRFLYYLCNYYARGKIFRGKFNDEIKLKESLINTTGEEYANIRKNFSKSNSNFILAYVFSYSIKKIFFKFLHIKFNSKIENFISRSHEENFISSTLKNENELVKRYHNSFLFRFRIIINRIIIKLSSNFPTFEQIIEKLEEIQFCYFFINGKFFDFLQRLFNFNYVKINSSQSEDEIQISKDGFKFFGYLMGIKLLFETVSKLKTFYKTIKIEKQKLNKEILELKKKENSLKSELPEITENKTKENLFKFNLKSKKISTHDHLQYPKEEENSCLLCLDQRTNTSATPCGHLFCWSCLIKYLQLNDNCPFCRQKCQASEIIFLQNLK